MSQPFWRRFSLDIIVIWLPESSSTSESSLGEDDEEEDDEARYPVINNENDIHFKYRDLWKKANKLIIQMKAGYNYK